MIWLLLGPGYAGNIKEGLKSLVFTFLSHRAEPEWSESYGLKFLDSARNDSYIDFLNPLLANQ